MKDTKHLEELESYSRDVALKGGRVGVVGGEVWSRVQVASAKQICLVAIDN